MSKIRTKAIDQALNQAVALRRKLVDCRFPRAKESELLDRATELLTLIEQEQQGAAEPGGAAAGGSEASDGE